MSLPLNGRVAIVDDVYEQAEPIMRALAKHQIPYTFYKGADPRFLPEKDSRYNDIRLLFLDINLLDDKAVPNEKQIRSALIYALERILSPDNFPYSIIFWSRHQEEHSQLIIDIFSNELKDRKPILFKGFVKSDFFPNYSSEEVENNIDLKDEIEKIIEQQEAYSQLLVWENQVHLSADTTLQDLFSSYHKYEHWSDNANYIVKKLAKAYLEKHINEVSSREIIRSSFYSLNAVFKDYLESSIRNLKISDGMLFDFDKKRIVVETKFINRRINISETFIDKKESGCILIGDKLPTINLEKIVSFRKLKEDAKTKLLLEGHKIEESRLDKILTEEAFKSKHFLIEDIKRDIVNIALVVTPICDFAQKNNVLDRIVSGGLIPTSFRESIDDRSEAIYILPISLCYEQKDYILLLDFRYFSTTDLNSEIVKPISRIRQELLAEIQSKLSRHINRQGILFLDERV
ncbi:MAG: hypothetical protein WBP45_07960 [Daejeonella sp.]